jgi:hypothetical protein
MIVPVDVLCRDLERLLFDIGSLDDDTDTESKN